MKCYPEYRESGLEWIGKIPTDWHLKRLKYVMDLNMGQSPPSEDYNDNQLGTPFLQGCAEFDQHHPTPKIYCETANKHARCADILLSVRAPVGEINIADQRYGIGRGLCAIRSRTGQLECHYARYLIEVVRTQLYVVATGSTFSAVTVYQVSNITCVVPPLFTQTQIANFLDRKTQQIDDLVRVKERKIELLGEYRASLIQQAVTKGLDPDVEMKQSGVEWIGEIPKHWAISKVKHELESLDHLRVPLNSETRGSMKSKVYDYYGASGVIDEVEAYIFDESLILIGEDGANLYLRSTPLAFKATGKYWVNNHAHVLRPRHGNIDYLTNMLESLDYTHYISGAAQPKLTAGRLMNITVVIPPLSEQNQIANFLDHKTRQIDELRSNEEQTIKLLKEYRQSLISAVVTGKIDVRNEV